MAYLDDRAGGSDGYWAKALHADTPSGRQAGWAILQDYADALFPAGCNLTALAARHIDHRPARMPRLPRPANDDTLQLSLDLTSDTTPGRYRAAISAAKRNGPRRVYRRGGVAA
ncbi:hypothetical protein ACIU1J_27490 [Azospirillum doebereinerae]